MKIIQNRKIWFVISGILILASIAALAIWRINLGIDFTGGSLLEVAWSETQPAVHEVRETLDPLLERSFVVQPGEESVILRAEPLSEEQHLAVSDALREAHGEFTELRFDSIGPVIGAELVKKTFWALAIVFVAIIFYVAWSFRKMSGIIPSWKAGLVTIFTGLHDVMIPLGLFAILGKFFGTEVNAAFVAAALTILGYSINDTIVIFDRIRENLTRGTAGTFIDTVEASVRQSFARSINTSITTLAALTAVFLFGGATIHDFILVLIVGIAIGAYSSIFLASPLLVAWHKK